MSLLDPRDRSRRGASEQKRITHSPETAPTTLLEESWRDYVFAEVWTRPGLDQRSRYLIALTSAANEADHGAVVRYAKGALVAGELTLAELREAALHFAVYAGWTYGGVLDAAITEATKALGIDPVALPPIRPTMWDPAERLADGSASFAFHMNFGSPPPRTAYFEGGILNFVFGEMWNRPGLDQRSRRWITLVGVGNSSSYTPIHSHVWSAIKSGNATTDEMYEFVLQYAVHAGWPRASVMQGAVMEQSKRVAEGRHYTD